jgi:hypothetical protein
VLWAVIAAATTAFAAAALIRQELRWEQHRQERRKYVDKEKEKDNTNQETLHSILDHFNGFQLDDTCSVDEANKRRTTRYYELARDSHVYDLVVGVRSYTRLRNRRDAEMARIFIYWNLHLMGDTKSHRTVIAMCDATTQKLLCEARDLILRPLDYSTEISTEGVWIPEASLMSQGHMHVTVALPWWWHTVRPGNRQLSEELVARFRQALVVEFHHPFQIELERIVLLGGKTLVALWRTVGERKGANGEVIFDRHGDCVDPFVKLRRDIVRCFTSTENFQNFGKEPLTYSHRFQQVDQTFGINNENSERPQTPQGFLQPNGLSITKDSLATSPHRSSTAPPKRGLKRQNTIELKTPGLGDHDGFIHTTLARLPLDCLSMKDVELGPIHRLCREATATYCGHRMVISKFRFVETMGAGGDSNPCVEPILFDDTVDAPPRVEVKMDGGINESNGFSKNVDRHVTIGSTPVLTAKPALNNLFPELAL